ncbi:MAG TPA: hypothetical protein VEA36_01910 [Candidatus Paceibacterota bacterium]|nr:hypothetical protein [Candidatus Paceibacterota bacterium]
MSLGVKEFDPSEVLTAFRRLDRYTKQEWNAISRRDGRARAAYQICRTLKKLEQRSRWFRELSELRIDPGYRELYAQLQATLGLTLHLAALTELSEADAYRLGVQGWPFYEHDPKRVEERYQGMLRSKRFETQVAALAAWVATGILRLEQAYCGQRLLLGGVREVVCGLLTTLRDMAGDLGYCANPYLEQCIKAAANAARRSP